MLITCSAKVRQYIKNIKWWCRESFRNIRPEDAKYLLKLEKQEPKLVTKIHPRDEIFHFFTTHPDHKTTPFKSYFTSGEGMLQRLQEILLETGISLEDVDSFLEFACGYGRFTRHLTMCLDPQKITVSDVYKKAIDFQKSAFGVEGFYSEINPDELDIPGEYEVIFIASLFSHLPKKTWRLWLKKLFNSLKENGVLIFSTHGPSCMAKRQTMPDSGFAYYNFSESNSLSSDDYGTTYVTPEFVLQAVKEETGQSVIMEIPNGLWGYQDVYVVKCSVPSA